VLGKGVSVTRSYQIRTYGFEHEVVAWAIDEDVSGGLNPSTHPPWGRTSDRAKRGLVVDSGITVRVAAQPFSFHIDIPTDVLARRVPGYAPAAHFIPHFGCATYE